MTRTLLRLATLSIGLVGGAALGQPSPVAPAELAAQDACAGVPVVELDLQHRTRAFHVMLGRACRLQLGDGGERLILVGVIGNLSRDPLPLGPLWDTFRLELPDGTALEPVTDPGPSATVPVGGERHFAVGFDLAPGSAAPLALADLTGRQRMVLGDLDPTRAELPGLVADAPSLGQLAPVPPPPPGQGELDVAIRGLVLMPGLADPPGGRHVVLDLTLSGGAEGTLDLATGAVLIGPGTARFRPAPIWGELAPALETAALGPGRTASGLIGFIVPDKLPSDRLTLRLTGVTPPVDIPLAGLDQVAYVPPAPPPRVVDPPPVEPPPVDRPPVAGGGPADDPPTDDPPTDDPPVADLPPVLPPPVEQPPPPQPTIGAVEPTGAAAPAPEGPPARRNLAFWLWGGSVTDGTDAAPAGPGAEAFGGSGTSALFDGNSTDFDDVSGFARAEIGSPITIVLPSAVTVQRVRFQLWDRDARFFRYRLEGSGDGLAWTTLAERTAGEQRGLQEIVVGGTPIQYFRLTGTAVGNATDAPEIRIVEFEAVAGGVNVARVPALRRLVDHDPGTVWTAPPAQGSRVTLTTPGGAPALLDRLMVQVPEGEGRPQLIRVTADDGAEIGVFRLEDRAGWHAIPLDGRTTPRLLLDLLATHDGRPARIGDLALTEATAPGYRSVLPFYQPGFEGGLNLALAALGGRIERASSAATDAPAESLIDGRTGRSGATGWFSAPGAALPQEIVLSFRGQGTARVGAVALNGDAGFGPARDAGSGLSRFEVWVSATSAASGFRRAGSYLLDPGDDTQIFAFPPVDARFVMVRALGNRGGGQVALGEIEVLEAPAQGVPSLLASQPPDLLDPALGGHMAVPRGQGVDRLLDGTTASGSWLADAGGDGPVDLVFAFADHRPARIDGITVALAADVAPEDWVASFGLAVSTDSPIAGFLPVGEFTVAPGEGAQTLAFRPIEARYVRLRILGNGGGARHALAEVGLTEVLQTNRPSAAARRYGPADLAALGVFRPAAGSAGADPFEPNDDPSDAAPLVLGEAVDGVIAESSDRDVFLVDTASAALPGLTVNLSEQPALHVGLTLSREDGTEIDRRPLYDTLDRDASLTWDVAQGRYLLTVERPVTSIAILSDLSPATEAVRSEVTQSLTAFVDSVSQFEEVSVAGFCSEIFEVADFTSNRRILRDAVATIELGCEGSALYDAMSQAIDGLADRPGAKAVLVVTGGEDTGADPARLDALWDRIAASGVRVYTVGHGSAIATPLPGLGATGGQLLRAWSDATAGRYADAPDGAAIDRAVAAIGADLRQGSSYRLVATSPEAMGGVRLAAGGLQADRLGPPGRVLLLLDASGSMAARDADGPRRIDIVRDALRPFVERLPDESVVGLRVFGHRFPREPAARSCGDTELVQPLAPLDLVRLLGSIDGLQPQGQTAIGRSLAALAQDLAGADGPTVAVLVTDGIENCDAAPGTANFPPEVMERLRAEGIDVRLSIVGFAVSDDATRAFLEATARQGGGAYFEADGPGELAAALDAALGAEFAVLDARGAVVASGQVGGGPVAVPAGRYVADLPSDPPLRIAELDVLPGLLTEIALNAEGQGIGIARTIAQLPPQPAAGRVTGPGEGAAGPPGDDDGPVRIALTVVITDPSLIRQAQTILRNLGLYRSTVDGIAGPGTASAIAAFQRSVGLPEDGFLTDALLARLEEADAARPVEPDAPPDDPSGASDIFGPVEPDQPAGAEIVQRIDEDWFAVQDANVRSGPGTAFGRIGGLRRGDRVRVEGRVASSGWLAIRFGDQTAFVASSLLTETEPAAVQPDLPSDEVPQPDRPTAPGTVQGTVLVLDVGNLLVNGQPIRLVGVVAAGNAGMIGRMQTFIDASGGMATCEPAGGGRYRCRTRAGVDIGEAAIFNGVANAETNAPARYRVAEEQARDARRGIWAN